MMEWNGSQVSIIERSAVDSIVLELQRKALNADCDVAELVRMALVAATKLGLCDFRQWAERELNGYKDNDVPPYRVLKSQVKAYNPYSGLIPVVFRDSELGELVRVAPCKNRVSELQYMVQTAKGPDCIQVSLSVEATNTLMKGLNGESIPTKIIATSQVVGVLDAIRTAVLDWALRLEQTGILGNGFAFSTEEKQRAASNPAIQITHFHGVLGTVHATQFQIGDYASIHNQLKEAGISQAGRNELENILDELHNASGEKRKSLLRRGVEWVAKHGETLGKLTNVIRTWFTGP